MAGLAVEYSKQIARELTKVAVSPPGFPASPGDLIVFPMGRVGLLRRERPYGSFNVVGTLEDLGIRTTVREDADPDPYIFATRGGSDISFNNDTGAAMGAGGAVSGTLDIKLTKENALYFAAIDCKTARLNDMISLQQQLQERRGQIPWDRVYLVMSVTTAGKALVMQASSGSASLKVEGDVKGLMPGNNGTKVDSTTQVSVSKFSAASFIKPWSDNVSVFLGLAKLSRRRDDPERRFIDAPAPRTLTRDGEVELVPVSPNEFVPADSE